MHTEGGLRVPSVVSLPGKLPQGEVRHQLVTGCDWFPTIAEITGSKTNADRHLDGKSIVNVINSSDAPSPHKRFYWQLGANPKNAQWVVREGDWKLYANVRENVRPEGTPELTAEDNKLFLSNLKDDIGETTNLTGKHADVVKRLKKYASEYQNSINEK